MAGSIRSAIIGGIERPPGPSAAVMEVRSPWDGLLAGRVALAGAAEADEAVTVARTGFTQTRSMAAFERARVLQQIADGIRTEREAFARLITVETGKPIQYSRVEVDRASFTFATAAAEAVRVGGEILPLDLAPGSEGRTGIVRRFPLGVILCIAPFNYPLNLVAHKLGPAIAAGNAFILKPAPQAPLTALKLGEIIEGTDFPKDAWSILPCDHAVAEGLVRDERIGMLSFTGSAAVGWHLRTICGRMKTLLELGGNAGVIVDESASLDSAVPRNVMGAFVSAGQVCIKVQRVFVHDTLYDDYAARFVEAAGRLACGNPMVEKTIVGPLIDDRSADRVDSWVDEAIGHGGKALLRGRREGRLLTPTVLANVPPSCAVVSEEVFGPVVVLERFTHLDEAVSAVNSSRFGLQAGIFTNDLANAWRAFRDLEVGAVVVNDNPTYRIDHMPYGGVKGSGMGREGVKYAIEAMTEPRLLVLGA